MSILNKNHNPQEQPYPLLDVSPYFPTIALSDTITEAENDFMSISLENKYIGGSRAYPLRGINSESSNLMYLACATLTTYDGCLIRDASRIYIDYKLTRIKPVAICMRPSVANIYAPNSLSIHGYRKIGGSKKTIGEIGKITDLTKEAYRSGVFYLNEEQSEYYDGLIVTVGQETVDSKGYFYIGTLKILGYPQKWDSNIQSAYNGHVLSLFDHAAATTNPEKGQINYMALQEGEIII